MKRQQKGRSAETPPDLDGLINGLDVRFAWLAECLVSKGYRLEMGRWPEVGIHYNVVGSGTMTVSDGTTIELVPHTLIVLPPNHSFAIVVDPEPENAGAICSVDGVRSSTLHDGIRRFVAGTTDPALVLICGFFSASYGKSTELFTTLSAPVVEYFAPGDQLDVRLRQALHELVAQEAGSGAMSAALLKQVIVMLMRRSLATPAAWTERFAVLSDVRIARAFAEMVADPGGHHSVDSLARIACLSRSAFMARFTSVMGRAPMMLLRELRMRRAAEILETKALSVGEVAHEVGYSSPSSFVRAFRETYGVDPSEYRSRARSDDGGRSRAVSPDPVSPSPK